MTREEAREALSVLKIYDAQWLREAVDMAIEALSNCTTEKPNDIVDSKNDTVVEPTDLISRADAIEAVENNSYGMGSRASVKAIKALPSADAETTVIRSRTLLPTKDFKEWAKRIREENPNAIIIPCDAEVVSTDAEWIPVSDELPKENEYVGGGAK